MKLYIAEPMTGIADYNYPMFKDAAKKLREAGYLVECPAEHDLPANTSWNGFVRHGITKMLTCDAVAILPAWQRSKGATIEVGLAQRLGMRVEVVAEWLR